MTHPRRARRAPPHRRARRGRAAASAAASPATGRTARRAARPARGRRTRAAPRAPRPTPATTTHHACGHSRAAPTQPTRASEVSPHDSSVATTTSRHHRAHEPGRQPHVDRAAAYDDGERQRRRTRDQQHERDGGDDRHPPRAGGRTRDRRGTAREHEHGRHQDAQRHRGQPERAHAATEVGLALLLDRREVGVDVGVRHGRHRHRRHPAHRQDDQDEPADEHRQPGRDGHAAHPASARSRARQRDSKTSVPYPSTALSAASTLASALPEPRAVRR